MSPGCAHCYAEAWAERYDTAVWGEDGVRRRTADSNWAKPLRWEKLAREGLLPKGEPNPDGHRPRVFCASLADVFEPRPELEPWRLDLFRLIADTPHLAWLLLTKRPEEARDWMRDWFWQGERLFGTGDYNFRDGLDWGVLPNIWIGASVENARFTWRADVLREIPATVRFLSCEPLVGSLFRGATSGESPDVADGPRQPDAGSNPAASTFNERVTSREAGHGPSDIGAQSGVSDAMPAGSRRAPLDLDPERHIPASEVRANVTSEGQPAVGVDAPGRAEPSPRSRALLNLNGIDWVIAGGESGGRDSRPMHPAWARELRDAVLAVSIADEPVDITRLRPGFHMKQWGSWAPADPAYGGEWRFGDGRERVWITPNGRIVPNGDPVVPVGSAFMRYAGERASSGGKYLDGVDWCEFPEASLTLA